MKIIYLDIDGVLNSAAGSYFKHIDFLEVNKLKILSNIISVTNCSGVVLTSSRRRYKSEVEFIKKTFNDFNIPLLDCIRLENGDSDSKAKCIIDHVLDNIYHLDNFVVIDDNDFDLSMFFKQRFFQVSSQDGLNEEKAKEIISILL